MWWEYWYLFPVGVLVASVAMSSGLAGSNFWIPIYLLWLGLEPRVAFCVSLFTMLFGFGSGVVRNLHAGTIDFHLVGRYLVWAAPATAVAALASRVLPVALLLAAFAAFVVAFATWVLRRELSRSAAGAESADDRTPGHGRVYRGVGVLAGLLQGAVATGSGALLLPCLIDHRRFRHHGDAGTAVGTTVVLVFLLSVVSVVLRIDAELFATLRQEASLIAAILLWEAPGVVIGGQLGPRLARRLPRRTLRLYVAGLLYLVGTLVAVRAFGT